MLNNLSKEKLKEMNLLSKKRENKFTNKPVQKIPMTEGIFTAQIQDNCAINDLESIVFNQI